jgi:hypothetical protein
MCSWRTMYNITKIESTRFSHSNKIYCFTCFRECTKYSVRHISKFGRTVFEILATGDKSTLAQFLAVMAYRHNYEIAKQSEKWSNQDYCFSPIIIITNNFNVHMYVYFFSSFSSSLFCSMSAFYWFCYFGILLLIFHRVRFPLIPCHH